MITRQICVPEGSSVKAEGYRAFLENAYELLRGHGQYVAAGEDINSIELAHLIPEVPETILAIYVGINDAVCNKGLVTPFLVRHGHNNVFVFDEQVYGGGKSVPAGTVDVRQVLRGFEAPNETWNPKWTYVMIADPKRTFASLWQEKGYIDMVAAKFEDFTMLTPSEQSKLCVFIDPKAFEHPVNKSRPYLAEARKRGDATAGEFTIPAALAGETTGLVPVVLECGEKLYVATPDFGPCAHAWSNIHTSNKRLAVVNENSAVPLDLVISKPPVDAKFGKNLRPAKGSADMTTDWFYRGKQILRAPILQGLFKG